MIYEGVELYGDKELVFIYELLMSFKEDEVPGYKRLEYRRDYYRQQVELMDSMNDKLLGIIKKHTGKEATINATWVNRIDDTSNSGDDYHRDDTDLSFVYYPTKDFEGGELECIVNDEIINTPVEANTYIILTNKIKHRVKPVTSGIRWSIASFCSFKQTSIKLV